MPESNSTAEVTSNELDHDSVPSMSSGQSYEDRLQTLRNSTLGLSDIPRYPGTNYCGPGQAPGRPDPTGPLDRCCERHDDCYTDAGLGASAVPLHFHGIGATRKQIDCDAALCNCAGKHAPVA